MPARPTGFDYSALLRPDAEVARQAAEGWRELIAVELRATNGWLEKGRFLARVWAALGHGHRLGWLKHETGLTEKTAERYIAAYELMLPHVDFDNLSNLPKLERSAVYELCGDVHEDIKRTFIPRIIDGERGLRRQILQAIEALKPDVAAPAPAVDEADSVEQPDTARMRDERAFRFTGALSVDARAVVADTLRLIREGVPLDDLEAGLTWDAAAPAIGKDAADTIIDSGDTETAARDVVAVETVEPNPKSDRGGVPEPGSEVIPGPEPELDSAPRRDRPCGPGSVRRPVDPIRDHKTGTVELADIAHLVGRW